MMKRNVIVIPYDPAWPGRFAGEAAALRAMLGDEITAVHHIGSTAVPGMAAKPIIDLLVEVSDIQRIDSCNPRMLEQGYLPRGENGIPGRRYFIHGDETQRSAHVHIYQAGHAQVLRHLALRDYLAAHPQQAQAYSQLKLELAAQFPQDIDGYVEGKEVFVAGMEKRAMAWRGEEYAPGA